MNQTTVYLYSGKITHIEYENMGRLNSASNIMTIISNYLPGWDMGVSFILPNGRVTKKYKAFLEENTIDITEDLATTGELPENVVGEEWYARTLTIPSTILNTAFSVYAENLPFSINISKCIDPDASDVGCTQWARINTETKYLAILSSVVGSYEDIEVDLGSVQGEISRLYDKVNKIFDNYGNITDVTELDDRLEALNTLLEEGGGYIVVEKYDPWVGIDAPDSSDYNIWFKTIN